MSRRRRNQLPNELRRYRRARGLRLRDVANLIGQSSVAHIAHWEKSRKSPSLENSIRLAIAVQCPMEVLFLGLYNQLKQEVNEAKDKHHIQLKYE